VKNVKITKGLKEELRKELMRGLSGGHTMDSTHSVGVSRGGSPP
jgi:hypothetical protein